jgi:hypothetical protein
MVERGLYSLNFHIEMPKYYVTGTKNGKSAIFPKEFPEESFSTEIEIEDSRDVWGVLNHLKRSRNYLSLALDSLVRFKGSLLQKDTEVVTHQIEESIPLPKSTFVSDDDVGKLFENGIRAGVEMLENESLDYSLWLVTHWYAKGIYSRDVYDQYLSFWRPIELLTEMMLNNRQERLGHAISEIFPFFESETIGALRKSAERLVATRAIDQYDWLRKEYGMPCEFTELCKYYDIRCAIAHGKTGKINHRTIMDEIQPFRKSVRNLIANYVEKVYGISLPTYPELDKLEFYRSSMYFNMIYERRIGTILVTVDGKSFMSMGD